MSEVKRRTKSTEPRDAAQAERPARKQTQVTLTKDVSSKYRKIIPKGPVKKTSPKPAGRRQSSDFEDSAHRQSPVSGKFSRPRRQSPAVEEEPRPRRQASTSREAFSPAAKSRGRVPEGGAAPRRARPATGSGQPGGGQFPRRTPAPKSGRGDGRDLEMRAIIHRELPEAAKQVREAQTLILNTAHDMLTLTESLEGIHEHLDKALEEILKRYGHLDEALTPVRDHAQKAGELITKLYEKMSFQDLAGQRLAKVENFLTALTQVLGQTTSTFSGKSAPFGKKTMTGKPPTRSRTANSNRFKDNGFDAPARPGRLKGPQATGEGLAQNAIDQLLAEL